MPVYTLLFVIGAGTPVVAGLGTRGGLLWRAARHHGDDGAAVEQHCLEAQRARLAESATFGSPLAPSFLRSLVNSNTTGVTNLQNVPVLVFAAEASYHAIYDHCTAKYLKQAGVKTDFVRLEDVGIKGNGHMVMIEKNNLDIAAMIAGFIESGADGYQATIGERGVRLSGGQRQRIGIARAIYKQAKLLVFDEATSALDSKTEAAVISSVMSLSQDLTIIMIAHRVSTLENCDMIVEIDQVGKARVLTDSEVG